MNLNKASWLTNTGRMLTLTGSMFVAEAGAQEAPKSPDAGPPITREYQDRIMDLLQKTRLADNDARYSALRNLEAALEGRETSDLMKDTRREILAVFRIRELKEDLQSEDLEQVQRAAKELTTKWLEDENFYVRSHAKDILDERFKDDREHDPRYQPPDVSAYTKPLTDMKPVRSMADWKKSPEVEELIVLIRHRAEGLDDNDWKTREKTTSEIYHALLELRKVINPLPQEITDLLNPKGELQTVYKPASSYKRAGYVKEWVWQSGWQSAEKRVRATRIHKRLEIAPYADSALPPMETTIADALQSIESHLGVHIECPSTTDIPIRIEAGNNNYTSILLEICRQTDTYPECNGHIRNIRLVPRSKAGKAVDIIPLKSAVAVLLNDPKEAKSKLHLFMDPQVALLSIEDVEASNESKQEIDLGLLPDEEVNWNVAHSGWKKPVRAMPVKQSISERPSVTLNAWLANNTRTHQMNLEDFNAVSDGGPHNYNIMVKKSDDGKAWTATLSIGIYEHLPWPATPHESDTKTYCAAEATNVVFTDSKGVIITAERSPMEINQRRGTITFTLPSEPAHAAVTTYRAISQQKITFPLDGSDTESEVIASHIPLNQSQ